MRKILITLSGLLIFSVIKGQDKIVAKNPVVVTGKLIRTTKALRDLKVGERLIPNVIVRDLDGIIGKDEAYEEGEDKPLYPSSKIFSTDPALQSTYPNNPHTQNAALRAIGANFNGIGYQPLNPPDPTLCVGPNHVIQMINGSSGALFKVYNKSGGQVVAQTYMDQITGKGGLGDPICLYDQLADRFVLTEFANKGETGTEGLVIAVSKTSDPAGQWYVYYFSTGTTFPDYPKFSVWPDAYYATTNDFALAQSYVGSSVYAFDRTKMLAGNATASMQKFTLGSASKYFTMSPVCLEGATVPPAGSGGLIAYMQDDTWTGSSTDVDSIGMFEFKVDFITPSNTRVNAKSSLATIAYKSNICTATRGQCISQPGTATALEALHQRIMNQPVYRNFGGYEGIVMNHVVDKGSGISGIRWYELRKTTGNWSIYQQSTYSPDNTHRWMAGICYDKYGNIGLAYNVSSSATGVYPGARYTGRKECDPLNTMTYSEDVIIAGTASCSSTRYGDYSHLVCDPDGVTFWFTSEYNVASTWSTRIASFTLDACQATVCNDPTQLNSTNVTTTSASVSWSPVANVVSYSLEYKQSSSSTWLPVTLSSPTSTSYNFTGLAEGTTYNWRVKTNCAEGSSNFVQSQFTTATTPSCNPPSGLSSTPATTSAAVNWSAVSGAISYDVYYAVGGSGNWQPVAIGTVSTSANISNLTASTNYDWRVRANCTSLSGGYTNANFTTLADATCNPPSGLSSNPSTTSAIVSWNAVSGANSYHVYYALGGTGNWQLVAFGTTATSANISNLTPSTNYDWLVRANCSSTSSVNATASFTTLADASCNPPTGLSSNPGTTSAAVSWNAVSGANSYDIYYAISGSGNWQPVAIGTAATSANITNLSASTNYDWRVRANCSSSSSTYTTANFTTSAAPTCNPPAGLSSNPGTTSAAVSWNAVSGANSYDVYYAIGGSGNWQPVVIGTSSTSANISNLTESTNYDWRVRSNCTSLSSGFTVANFTTTAAPTCNPPTGLSSTPGSTSAAVSWNAVSGANSYDVYYAVGGSGNWQPVVIGTSSTSANISNLTESTNYDWRVRANCTSLSSGYTMASFTTLAVTTCPDQLEPNETVSTARSISTNVNINAQVASATDKDYYSFSSSGGQKNVKVTLTNLPANYNLVLYSNSGTVLRTSAQAGTADETVIYNTNKPNGYKVSVIGATPADYSSTSCYTLRVSLSGSSFTSSPEEMVYDEEGANNVTVVRSGLKIFPVPATNAVTISFDAYSKGTAEIIILNQLGQPVLNKKVLVNDGININTINVNSLTSGVYTLKVNNGKEIQTKKIIISR